jgi:hypothetical protein
MRSNGGDNLPPLVMPGATSTFTRRRQAEPGGEISSANIFQVNKGRNGRAPDLSDQGYILIQDHPSFETAAYYNVGQAITDVTHSKVRI